MSKGKTVVLFPGLWGNRHEGTVKWFFRNVISIFERRGWKIVIVTYRGDTLKDYIERASAILQHVPAGSFAVCHSSGAQVARAICKMSPEQFSKVALISGTERGGMHRSVLMKALRSAFKKFLKMIFGKGARLETVSELHTFFVGNTSKPSTVIKGLNKYLHEEPGSVLRALMLPLFRARQSPFPCKGLALVPEKDFFLPSPSYRDEDMEIKIVSGDHSLMFGNPTRVRSYIERIEQWFSQS
jgi:pimeloyl-ACP methyl ester carboxylesterase